MERVCDVDELAGEFADVSLRDRRLVERLRRIVELTSTAPEQSFPVQMPTVADREALYRFFGNRKVTLEALVAGHLRQTHERLRHQAVVRVAHDTTTFHFPGERKGLGRGGDESQSVHVSTRKRKSPNCPSP
jgi:hypothetical protein